MKQNYKKFILIIMIIGTFLLAGCNKLNFDTFDASKEEAGSEITSIPEENQDSKNQNKEITKAPEVTQAAGLDNADVTVGVTAAEETPTPDSIQPNANIDLTVYTVNADTGEIEPVTALIPEGSEITPDLIVSTVVDSMADQSIEIGIDSVTTQEDKVIVSFLKDKAPYSDMGSGYEAAILDAIAQSLIDNLKDYKKVIYRVEGNAYVSGVFEYGIDEVYMGDNE